MKQFEIEVIHPNGDIRFATVLDYQEIEAGHLELCGGNRAVTDKNVIKIRFDYPLSKSVTKTFQSQAVHTPRSSALHL